MKGESAAAHLSACGAFLSTVIPEGLSLFTFVIPHDRIRERRISSAHITLCIGLRETPYI
jgi:hypothetical protein